MRCSTCGAPVTNIPKSYYHKHGVCCDYRCFKIRKPKGDHLAKFLEFGNGKQYRGSDDTLGQGTRYKVLNQAVVKCVDGKTMDYNNTSGRYRARVGETVFFDCVLENNVDPVSIHPTKINSK